MNRLHGADQQQNRHDQPRKGKIVPVFFVWRLQQFRQLFAEKEIMYHLIQL